MQLRIQTLLNGSFFSLWYGSGSGPDPYHFKEIMYLKQYPHSPTGPTQKVLFVQFSLSGDFVVLMRVAYGSGSWKIIRIRIRNTKARNEKWHTNMKYSLLDVDTVHHNVRIKQYPRPLNRADCPLASNLSVGRQLTSMETFTFARSSRCFPAFFFSRCLFGRHSTN
jgi:hypothetical protein